jgi:hypothetical protein
LVAEGNLERPAKVLFYADLIWKFYEALEDVDYCPKRPELAIVNLGHGNWAVVIGSRHRKDANLAKYVTKIELALQYECRLAFG